MVFNIETRKVQKTGGSSFIVSLPIEWIKSHKIHKHHKGYSLGIITQPDGNLLVTPNPNSEDILKTKSFNVDEIKDYNFLFRVLIGAYIMGYSKIVIKSSKKFEPFVRDCVINFTQIAIGPEIIEESTQNILIKDLLNPKEMPFEKTIRRMYILAETMHEDAITALKTSDKELAEEVIKRDNDIDRLHWLICRQSSIVLRDIILSQKMGITLEDANHYQQMSRLLERTGDHAVKIAKNAIKIIDSGNGATVIEKIVTASEISIKILKKSLDAWLQKDMVLANKNIESIAELIETCEEKTISADHSDIETYVASSYIFESIRRTGEYAGDISEIIINNLIKENE
ncbi:MAG: phosphate uptake regulator PhoU [Candidatus Lokiarchaeota archaeon]|nr:phosphate uptake regulator PhoU [Candidatus Lokiarchaeota archaeon]